MSVPRYVLILALFLGIALAAPAEDPGPDVWGGLHVALQVTATGAELEFDCATGAIHQPLPTASSTSFRLQGTYTPEHGGPVRENEKPATRDAIYSGAIESGTMHLRIEVAGQEQPLEFVLHKGRQGRVMKCR